MDYWSFVRGAEWRFFQERDPGLDLYLRGFPGIFLGVLAVSSGVIFLLAIFHVIRERRHVVRLLLGIGAVAGLLGIGISWLDFETPARIAALLEGDSLAGPRPASPGQVAAVISWPMLVGASNFTGNCLGCLYMAIFWGTSHLRDRSSQYTPRGHL